MFMSVSVEYVPDKDSEYADVVCSYRSQHCVLAKKWYEKKRGPNLHNNNRENDDEFTNKDLRFVSGNKIET